MGIERALKTAYVSAVFFILHLHLSRPHVFRHPDHSGKSPSASKPKAQALRRKDRLPRLPLAIILRETYLVMQLNWRGLLTLAWLVLVTYTLLNLSFDALNARYLAAAGDQFGVYLVRAEVLGLLRATLLDLVLLGFYTLAVYRLMLLGEPLAAAKFSTAWLRRYSLFLLATLQAMAWPLLAFVPYGLFIGLQVTWAGGGLPDFVPPWLVLAAWPTQLLKAACALAFYVGLARLIFVQPAAAVDVPYSSRESWRVTSWVWGQMLILCLATLGVAIFSIFAVQTLWPQMDGTWGRLIYILGLVLTCSLWVFGLTAFTVALSITFCLRTGWRPGAQKLSLNRGEMSNRTMSSPQTSSRATPNRMTSNRTMPSRGSAVRREV